MKICPCCTAQLDDDAQFCRNCGAVQPDAERLFAQPAPVEEPYDHTKEFDAQDDVLNSVHRSFMDHAWQYRYEDYSCGEYCPWFYCWFYRIRIKKRCS